ncbi:uncharacterized protein LOC119773968 [Cyprinodon tularosa]|uniref:uncharacterized protein LOC119773968 n=1 Tax=Cyprinodon tularosa TaxID=77115 RepID=UPI0018E1F811|nr:uncharacterized protein LOC119773968 [Cyprinodon tularosa]
MTSCLKTAHTPDGKRQLYQRTSSVAAMGTPSQSTDEELSVALLNINGLRNKTEDIRHIISRDKVHVLALSETKLDASVADSKVYIPGFRMWRKDRDSYGGGVALYVQDHIEAKERTDLMNPEVEIIWVEMEIPDSRPVLLGCCYIPNNEDTKYLVKLYESITKMLKKKEEKNIFVMGDFNIDFKKDSLLSYIAEKVSSKWGFKQIVEDPTRLTDKSATCIDHIYTNAADLCYKPESRVTGCSDHNLITVTVKIKIPKRVRRLRSNQDFNLDTFLADIKSADWKAVSEESDPEKSLLMLTEKFLSIADKNASIQTKDIYDSLRPKDRLETLISERDQAVGKMKKRLKKKELEDFVKKNKKKYFQQIFEEAKNDPKKLLKVFEEFLGESLPSYVISITEEGVEHLDPCCQTFTGTKDLESIFEGSREDEREAQLAEKLELNDREGKIRHLAFGPLESFLSLSEVQHGSTMVVALFDLQMTLFQPTSMSFSD